ncbi:MAG: hypothetical protein KDC98_08920, partial [Planctomycetes bacterium]|nr:hypothetical protein [Planctomycetota bacterium]
MRRALVSRLWLLLPALFALAWFWPVLGHGFRSDDFEMVYYLDRDSEAVRWGRVWEEWLRPWFGVRDLYRPVVSLAIGVNWACGTSAFGFHLLNVGLLCGTATCVAAMAARLAPARGALVGATAGILVVLHPAAVEPTAWIMARTTGLQVLFSALGYWSFVRWRDGEGTLALPLLATALACCSKEGAVLLPFSLLALDLVRGGVPNWRHHVPFFLLVATYLGWRRMLLGCFTTLKEDAGGEQFSGAWQLLGQLFWPPVEGGAWTLGVVLPLLIIAVGLIAAAGGRARVLWCLPWMFGLLTPGTTHLGAAASSLAGRFVFDAVPAVAVFVALAFAAFATRPRLVLVSALGVASVAVGFGVVSRAWIERYDADSRLIDTVQKELIANAQAAAPDRPFGVFGLPGQPLLHPPLWGFLTQRPFAERDLPVIGLSNILMRNPDTVDLFGDASVVHSLIAHGAGVGVWDDEARRLRPVPRAASGIIDFVQDPNDRRCFLPPRLLPPTAVAQLEIRSPTPVEKWRIEILGNLEGDYATRSMEVVAGDGAAVTWCDTTHVLPWLIASQFGGG